MNASTKHFSKYPPKGKIVPIPIRTMYIQNKFIYNVIFTLQHHVISDKLLPHTIAKIRNYHLKIVTSFYHFLHTSYTFDISRTLSLVFDTRFPIDCKIDMSTYIPILLYGISRFVLNEKIEFKTLLSNSSVIHEKIECTTLASSL